MAISSGVIWELRWAGSNQNGAGFNPESGGIDYSQQNNAQVSYSDLLIDSDTTKVSSAASPFTTGYVGNIIACLGGTVGFPGDPGNPQRFEIISVDPISNKATVDRSVGTAGASGDAKLGGAIPHYNTIQSFVQPGNTVYVSGGEFTTTTNPWVLSGGGNSQLPKRLIGYQNVRGDNGRPKLTQQTALEAAIWMNQNDWVIKNFVVTNATSGSGIGILGAGITPPTPGLIENVFALGVDRGFEVVASIRVSHCYASGCVIGFRMGSSASPRSAIFERCVAERNQDGWALLDGGAALLYCIAANNVGNGFLHSVRHGDYFDHCTAYNNGQDGIQIGSSSSDDFVPLIQNCIFEKNRRYAISSTVLDMAGANWSERIHRCAFFDNASGNFFHVPSGIASIFYTQTAFEGATSGNFRLNDSPSGGGLLRGQAIPGLFLGLDTSTTSGGSDVGAVPVSGLSAMDQDILAQDSGRGLDTVRIIKTIVILEDSDGIPPSGAVTCDQTPTLDWDDAITGSPPYRYHWKIFDAITSGFVTSGVVLVVSQVETSPLAIGSYEVRVTSEDTVGALFDYDPLLFFIRDCKDDLPILAIEVPEFDLEKVIPDVDDYIRYLPQWTAVHGTATEAPSASFTFKFFQPSLKEFRKLYNSTIEVGDQLSVLQVPVRLPRLAWHLQTKFTSRDPLVVTVRTSGIVNDVRRAASLFDFYTADDRAFIIGNTGHILFRNLALRQVLVSSSSTSGALQFQYIMPAEPEGIIPDTDVFFIHNGIEYRIKAGSKGIDPEKAAVQLKSPFSSPLIFKYHSKTLQPVVQVSISGEVYRSPDRTDLWNRLDELGVLASLTRSTDEDNLFFKQRILSRFLSNIGVDARTVTQKVAQDLTLSRVLDWNGRTTMSFSTSGIFGVSDVDVKGLPEIGYLTEELIASGAVNASFRFTSSKSNWLPGYVVYVDGTPVTKFRYPNLVVSGNIVDFGAIVEGRVFAIFRYRNYTFRTSSQSYITHLDPVPENSPSGSYQVLVSRNVRIHTPAEEGYINNSLLNADGTPNGFFHELQSRLLEGSSVYFTRASWGKNSHWFEEDEERPLTDHLPAIFDVGVF